MHEGYQERQDKGIPQKQLSKEFVRQWLIENGFQGIDGQQIPAMSDEKIIEISNRYIELYEQITGEAFVKATTQNVLEENRGEGNFFFSFKLKKIRMIIEPRTRGFICLTSHPKGCEQNVINQIAM